MRPSTATQTVSRPNLLQTLDAELNVHRTEIQRLESVRTILIGQEPKSVKRGSAPKKARRFQANATTTATEGGTTKRTRGRPKGSKNRPKVAVETSGEPVVQTLPTTEPVTEDTPTTV